MPLLTYFDPPQIACLIYAADVLHACQRADGVLLLTTPCVLYANLIHKLRNENMDAAGLLARRSDYWGWTWACRPSEFKPAVEQVQ